jgi:phosphatidylglycerophosphatase A
MNRVAHAIATTFGLGEVLPAPGTSAGSAPAAALWLGLAMGAPDHLVSLGAALVGLASAAGLWASEEESRRLGREDPGSVVIDEVAGQWLTLLIAAPLMAGSDLFEWSLHIAAGFLLFRLFDIVKPGPVRALERLGGGAGIMADDLAAGVGAGIVLFAITPWLRQLV